MFLRFFLSNQPFVLFLLIPIGLGFYALNFYFQFYQMFEFVDLGLWGKASWTNQWYGTLLTMLLVGFSALQLNFLFNKNEFLERNNYGPSLFYITFLSFSHSYYQLDGLLLTQVCWIQVIRLIARIRQGEDNRKEVFDAAFFVGLAATFHPPTSAFILILWLALWGLKQLNFREWLLSLIGFTIPFINALMYWWYSGHKINSELLKNTVYVEQDKLIFYVSSALIGVIVILSLIGVRIRRQKSSIRFKKLNRALGWMLFGGIALGTIQFILFQQVEWFAFIFIVLSFYFTFAFIHKFWNAIASFFFYLTFTLAIIKYFLLTHILV